MSTLSPRPLLPTFLPSLNALLAALDLPFTIQHPTDLTPSLLLAIFESLISARLPIPASIRQSRTKDAKSRAMLVLLGVLECDILRGGSDDHSIAASNLDDSVLAGAGGVSVDGWADEIGLGEVDPERLADGGWEETIFIGELLCWLARRKGILPRAKSSHRPSHSRSLYSNYHSYGDDDSADFSTSLLLRPTPVQKSRSPRPPSIPDIDPDCSALSHITDVPRHPLVHSPEPSFSTYTDLSIRARSVSSRTSVSNAHDDPDDEASQDTIQMYDPRQMMQDAEDDDDRPPTFRPHCIHELDDPSYIRALSHEHVSEPEEEDQDEQDNDDPYAPPTPTPRRVRLTGWIDPVDPTTELARFAASRSRQSAGSGLEPPPPPSQKYTRMSRPKADVSPLPRRTSRTPRRVSPSPSPPPPTRTSKHPPARTPAIPSPSPSPPPSPPTHSDPPFNISFSALNNTSTPAKPRPRRSQHPQSQPQSQTSAGAGARGGGLHVPRPRERERSPSYTPSPPSFSAPSRSRSAGTPTSGLKPSTSTGVGWTGPITSLTKRSTGASSSPPLPPARVKESSTTAVTNALLTERARLLTELAALKRARAMSSGGGAGTGVGTVTMTGTRRNGSGVRVGVGV